MTKKKNGFFSNIKNKFMKNKDSDDSVNEDEFSEDDEFIEEDSEDEFEEVEESDEEYEDDEESDESQGELATKDEMIAGHSEIDEDSEEDDADEVLASDEDDEVEEYEEEYEDDEAEESDVDVNEILNDPKNKKAIFSNFISKFSKKSNSQENKPNQLINPISTTTESTQRTAKSGIGLSELTPDQVIPFVIGSQNQRFIHKTFLIFLSFSVFYVFGKLTGIILSGQNKAEKTLSSTSNAPTYSSRSDIMAIKNNNIFNIRENEFEEIKTNTPKEPEVKVCIEANRKTSLPIKLVNSIVLQDSVKSIVSVSQRGKTENYREGERIGSVAEIGRIDSAKIIFKNLQSGQCEYVESSEKPESKVTKADLGVRPPKKVSAPIKTDEIEAEGNKFAIKKSLRDKLLSNIGDVLTQARAIQIKNPDGSLAFKMTEIVPGSIFSNLNIQDGDIVTGINGKKIENVNELMSMFGKLKENDSYELTVKRNGTETNLNYNFVE